ncbi:LytTR family transcriptional regulator DNA-binding domain-containing protein [Salipaludibacillus sp. LMS25]|jgi:ABC-2 type transport system ATP-binding protein|uniref:LytTR family transcriptional regulator DNA-binding domain-containing protein n=1 Tax=Salipaludibacillus sp. LMS25 TaxID=2924031 RepID=UPI0020D0FF14|nr:LytTR family transcriptional regulator DNA-binding domain-containing protein [Salipaludibacillus sp. LMS25]UTR13245.1 LytTR family transcriptional regulator DNA-binding domain-containing protein [Salipaludibacillus sp. LMS25]
MVQFEMRDVEKRRENSIVFSPFHLSVNEGEIASVHTTTDGRKQLLNWLTGHDPITSGEIRIGGSELTSDVSQYIPELGVVFLEEGVYPRLSVKEHLVFLKGLFQSTEKVQAVARKLQLEHRFETKAKHLSYSEMRRLTMAKLFFQNPQVIVIEEPDQNVDIETKRIVINLFYELKEEGKSLLILTSNMEAAITFGESVYRLNENGLDNVDMKTGYSDPPSSIDDLTDFKINKIPSKVNDKLILFDPTEIDYIESYSGQSHLHIRNEAFKCVFTMQELEDKLRSFGFFRCHRSYIVNLQKVKEVMTWTRNSYSLKIDDKGNTQIPLSKNKMAELKDMLGLK